MNADVRNTANMRNADVRNTEVRNADVRNADVLIVGYGPVGQVLANLLAQRDWNVTVVERWARPYTMPRAVAFDSEAGRILAAVGVGDFLTDFAEPSGEYAWRNADGQTLLSIRAAERGQCGWPDSTSMYQPGLESALAAQGAKLGSLRVLRGHRAVRLTERDGRVDVVVDDDVDGESLTFSARWVVGCDGANSFVRECIGSPVEDMGFSHDWLICDVVPHEQREFRPNNLQICDPARPRTSVSAGPGHRRWEFMRVPGETIEELDTPESAWRLLALFGIDRDNATLERHAVYSFQANWAERWRSGRLLIAGDAAHLMPPFAAQGMCSGFRDAANLAWKLDLVLGGRADDAVLDTYTVERRAHVQHAVGMSVNLGRVLCQTDPVAAADRDVVMLAARQRGVGTAQPKAAVQPLKDGLLYRSDNGKLRRPAGQLTPQARVAREVDDGWFDEVVGLGFVLFASQNPRELLDADRLAFLDALGTHVVWVVPQGAEPPDDGAAGKVVVDVEDVYLPYLTENDAVAVLVRPDFYAFGGAHDARELTALVDDLRARLRPAAPAAG